MPRRVCLFSRETPRASCVAASVMTRSEILPNAILRALMGRGYRLNFHREFPEIVVQNAGAAFRNAVKCTGRRRSGDCSRPPCTRKNLVVNGLLRMWVLWHDSGGVSFHQSLFLLFPSLQFAPRHPHDPSRAFRARPYFKISVRAAEPRRTRSVSMPDNSRGPSLRDC